MVDFDEVVAKTDVGRIRTNNEDNLHVAPGLLVVADGMGGYEAGEVASQIAVETVVQHADALREAASDRRQLLGLIDRVFQKASDRVEEAAKGNGMGTTLVCAVLAPDGVTAWIAHVGDSRAYLLRSTELLQLTTDHNVYEELLARGKDPIVARNHPSAHKLTQAIGRGFVQPAVAEVRLTIADTLLLCTDGLSSVVDDEQIADLLDEEIDDIGPRLVEAAHDKGAPDNVTVIAARAQTKETGTRNLAAVEHLANLFLFADLDRSQLSNVAPYLRRKTFQAGEYLTVEGDEADECLILIGGNAMVSRADIPLTDVHPGASVGELALIGPWTRSASVRALGQVTVYTLSRENYAELCLQRPRIGLTINAALSRHVAGRLSDLTKRLELVQKAVHGALDV